jgi:hypothetical protein
VPGYPTLLTVPTAVTTIAEVTDARAPIGRGLRWPDRVESDCLLECHRLR